MRALQLPQQWTQELLEAYYKQAQTPDAARRYHALLLCAKSYQRGLVAQIVSVSPKTLQNWIHQAIDQGLDSLATSKPGRGRKPKLNSDQQAIVDQWIASKPTITLAAIQQRIKQQWSIELSVVQVHYLVHKLSYRPITPKKQHYQADTQSQGAFKKGSNTQWGKLAQVNTISYLATRRGGV